MVSHPLGGGADLSSLELLGDGAPLPLELVQNQPASRAVAEKPRPPVVPSPTSVEDAVKAALVVSPENAERARKIGRSLKSPTTHDEAAEALLGQFAAREAGIVFELMDVETQLVALLGRTVTDPKLALKVAETLRETAAISSVVRRRVEGTLAAAANLRSQRAFVAGGRR